jgi:hypothetical protein
VVIINQKGWQPYRQSRGGTFSPNQHAILLSSGIDQRFSLDIHQDFAIEIFRLYLFTSAGKLAKLGAKY